MFFSNLHSTESIPINLTPLKINGKTLVFNSWDEVNPQQVATPSYFICFKAAARISPPTVSTTPAYFSANKGFVDVDKNSSLEIICVATYSF